MRGMSNVKQRGALLNLESTVHAQSLKTSQKKRQRNAVTGIPFSGAVCEFNDLSPLLLSHKFPRVRVGLASGAKKAKFLNANETARALVVRGCVFSRYVDTLDSFNQFQSISNQFQSISIRDSENVESP